MTTTAHYTGRPAPAPPDWTDFLDECEIKAGFIKPVKATMWRGRPVMTPEERRAKLLEAREARRKARWEAAKEGRVGV